MKVRQAGWAAATVALMTWSVSYGQDREVDVDVQIGESSPTGALYKASDLIGMEVRGENDADLGEVQDLLIDSKTEEVKFLVLDSGLLAGLDRKMTVIPWIIAEARLDAESEEHFVHVTLTEERLKTAPQINLGDGELAADAAWIAQVNSFFETEIQQRRVARPDLDADDDRRERQERRRQGRDRQGADNESDQRTPRSSSSNQESDPRTNRPRNEDRP